MENFIFCAVLLVIGQKHLSFYPPSFFNIDRVINFQIFLDNNFSVDYAGLYYAGSNFDSACKKPLFIKVAIFFPM